MTLNVAQYLAPLNSQQVLNGYVQGVKDGVGITILADGTITLDVTTANTLGFLTSSSIPAPVYNWSMTPGGANSMLNNDGAGNVAWSTDYVQTFPVGDPFPHTGAAAIPAGLSTERPANLEGLLRYNIDFDRLEFANGSAWIPVSPSTGGLFSFIGTSTPTANAQGDFWYDTNTGQEKVWNGVSWLPTSPLATALIPGRVKIGSNVQVAADGTISILPTTGVSGGVSNVGVTTITDNVTSLSVDSALSANQGRLLQNQINALLIANNLTFAGLIDGTGILTYVTPEGTLQGFTVGQPLPNPAVSNKDYFVMATSAGGFTPPGGVFTTITQGDWFVSIGSAWQFLNVGYDPPYATTTSPGIVRLSTTTETQAGTDNTVAVTPFSLNSRTALETRTGIAAIATQAQSDAGVDNQTFITPLKLKTTLSNGSINASNILLSPPINGNTTIQSALTDAVYDITSSGLTINITQTPTGYFNLDVTQATELQLGGGEIATQVETEAGTSDTTLVTPKKLRDTTVYKSDFNAKGDILTASSNDTPQILPVGGNGQVLVADTTQTTGLRWTTPGFYDLDDISGGFNGTAVTFPLTIGGVPYVPNPTSNIMVFLGSVAQIPGIGKAYTVTGSTITFTAAPPSGTTFYATTVRY